MRRFEQSLDRTMLDGILLLPDWMGFNPMNVCLRRVLHLEEELPIGEEYERMIKEMVNVFYRV